MKRTAAHIEIAIMKDLDQKRDYMRTRNAIRDEMARVKAMYRQEIKRLKQLEREYQDDINSLSIDFLAEKHQVGRKIVQRVNGIALQEAITRTVKF